MAPVQSTAATRITLRPHDPGTGEEIEKEEVGGGQMMAMLPEWNVGHGFVIFVIWAVMMLALMLPSAGPVTC